MELQYGRNELSVIISEKYSTICDLKSDILNQLGNGRPVEEDGSGFYLLHNGKLLCEDEQLASLELGVGNPVISVIPRILGGKGGFGSMLRAIGAQIEKTTNRDACRDLSGRRLRDINEEQRLKKWYAKQKERDLARREARKEKLEKLKHFTDGPALPKIEDQAFLQKREDIEDSVFDAVDKAFDSDYKLETYIIPEEPAVTLPSSSEQASPPVQTTPEETNDAINDTPSTSSSTSVATGSKKAPRKTAFEEEFSSDSSSDEDEDELEGSSPPQKKSKMN